MQRPLFSWLVAASAGLAASIPANARASTSDTVTAYGISQFGHANECGGLSQTHTAHTLSATAFTNQFQIYNQLSFWGPWIDVYDFGATSDDFTDPTKTSANTAERDYQLGGIDYSVVSYAHTHGGHSTTSNGGKGSSSFLMGNATSGFTCNVSTSSNFVFGNTEESGTLEIATIKACEGADFSVWKSGGYRAMVPADSRMQIYNGFHGDSSCGNFVADYVADFASESFADGAGENWIDEAYDSHGGGADDCPVTVLYGNSPSARANMFYSGGFLDRKLTNAKKSGSSYAFISGCAPTNGVVLPQ